MKSKTQTHELITKEMTIGDVVNKYPYLAEIMNNYGLHCMGCHANPYESILNGCVSHGIDEKTVDQMVEELNEAVKNYKEEDTSKNLIVTDKAAVKFKEFMKEEHKENCGVRLIINGAGGCCSDEHYDLEFAENVEKSEVTLNENGIKFFVDKEVADHLNLKIDFVQEQRGAGFKIDKNKSSGSCGSGCGCH